MKKQKIDINHLAKLCQMNVSDSEAKKLASQFADTLKIVALLEKLDTTRIGSTFQVTGLKNVFREDRIDRSNLHTQQQALKNAKKSHQGYFLVPAIFS